MSNVFVDVSSYQDDSASFFHKLKDLGAVAVVIKLTEGSNPGSAYVNPKAGAQLASAKAAGMKTGFYHYAQFNGNQDAKNEAAWFVKNLKSIGVATSDPVVLDLESNNNANPATSDAQAFVADVEAAGYTNTVLYASRSWLTSGRVAGSKFKKVWVAEYNSSTSYNGWSAWQYTDNWQGLHVDASYDNNIFSTSSTTSAPAKASTPTTSPAGFTDSLGVYWRYQKGTFKLNTAVNLRWGARTSSAQIATLNAGQSINYDAYAYSNGYVWIRQPRGNNSYGYLATGSCNGDTRTSYWGTFS